MPQIDGLDKFEGRVLHSHNYRVPEEFLGLRVACLGARSSGVDIAMELTKYCSQVYLCHNLSPLQSPMPANLIQKPGFTRFFQHSVELTDGSALDADAVIFCTGYDYAFPFLDGKSLPLTVENQRVTPLYHHLVHIEHPSLFLVGLCSVVLPFPHFDVQIRFCLSVLSGDCVLPGRGEMAEWERGDYCRRTEELQLAGNKAHYLGSMQWEYNRNLCELAGLKRCPIPPVVERLYEEVHGLRSQNVTNYKTMRFQLLSEEEFRTLDGNCPPTD